MSDTDSNTITSGLLGEQSLPLRIRIRGKYIDRHIQTVRDRKLLVGTDEGCQLRLPTGSLQPVHCWILRGAKRTVLHSLSQPVRLNGRQVNRCVIRPGDRIQMGECRIDVLDPQRKRRTDRKRNTSPAMPRNQFEETVGAAQVVEAENALAQFRDSLARTEAELQTRLHDAQVDLELRETRLREQQSAWESKAGELAEQRRQLDEAVAAHDQEHKRQRLLLEDDQQQLLNRQSRLMAEQQAFDTHRTAWHAWQGDQQQHQQSAHDVREQLAVIQSERNALEQERGLWQEEQRRHEQAVHELNERSAALDADRAAYEHHRGAWQQEQQQQVERASQQRSHLVDESAELARRREELDRVHHELNAARGEHERHAQEVQCRLGDVEADLARGREALLARHAELDRQRAVLEHEQAEHRQRLAEWSQSQAILDEQRAAFDHQRNQFANEREHWFSQQSGTNEEVDTRRGQLESEWATRRAALDVEATQLAERNRDLVAQQEQWEQSRRETESQFNQRVEEFVRRAEQLQATEQALATQRGEIAHNYEQLATERGDLARHREALTQEQAHLVATREALAQEQARFVCDRDAWLAQQTEQTQREQRLQTREQELNGRAVELERQMAIIVSELGELSHQRHIREQDQASLVASRHALEQAQAQFERDRNAWQAQQTEQAQAAEATRRTAEEQWALREQQLGHREQELDVRAAEVQQQTNQIAAERAELNRQRESWTRDQESLATIRHELEQERSTLASDRDNWQRQQAQQNESRDSSAITAELELGRREQQMQQLELKLHERVAELEQKLGEFTVAQAQFQIEEARRRDELAQLEAELAERQTKLEQEHDCLARQLAQAPEHSSERRAACKPEALVPQSAVADDLQAVDELDDDAPKSEEDSGTSEVLKRLQAAGIWRSNDDAPATDSAASHFAPMASPSEAPPSALMVEPAAREAVEPSGEAEEESIDQYMAKLLARTRGATHQTSGASPSLASTANRQSTTDAQSGKATRAADSGQAPIKPATGDRELTAVESAPKQRHRPTQPAFNGDIAAMRELANLSARSAIHVYHRRQAQYQVGTMLSIFVVSLGAGLYTLLRHAHLHQAGQYAGIAALVIAAFWGVQIGSVLLKLARLKWRIGATSVAAKDDGPDSDPTHRINEVEPRAAGTPQQA